MPGDAVDDVRADVFEQGQGAAPRVHPMAGRQRRAGLPLAMGHRSARRAADVDQSLVAQRARARRLRHERVHPVRAQRRRGAFDHGERRRAWRDRRKRRRHGSKDCNGPADVHVRRDAGARRPSGAVPGEVLGDRQRDLGRLGTRPFRRRARTRATSAIRRGDARRRSVDRGDCGRRQRHGVEPHRAPARGRARRLSGDSPLLRSTRHAGRSDEARSRGRCTTSGSTARVDGALPGAAGRSAAEAGDQRVGARPAGVAAVFDSRRLCTRPG